MGHDVTDEGLDVVGVALQLVEVGQLPLLVLQHLVRLLHPGAEGAHLPTELGQLLERGKQPEGKRGLSYHRCQRIIKGTNYEAGLTS